MFLTFDTPGWFNDMLRDFFGAIDHLVYSLIGWIMQGIFNLADLYANPNLANVIYRRIYLILGIYMIFKLSFSFLKYILNPEAMSDKEQGVGKIIVRVVTMVAMLVALPIILFEPLVEGRDKPILNVLQNGVLQTLPKIILGVSEDTDYKEELEANVAENGEKMALMMLRSFYYPTECNSEDEESVCDFTESNGVVDLRTFKRSLKASDGAEYTFYYMWPLTTIAGILMVVILLGIAIDVAIRAFKLVILQMVAPVPIMSYIDPKSSKDGAFNSWLKKYISTYIEVFIKIGAVYILLLLISKVFADDGLFGDGIDNAGSFMNKNFVRVFLVIGLFKFIKELPKFVKEVMGIKDNGSGGGFMGKAFGAMAGAAAGFAGGLMTGGLAGGMSGIMSGASAGAAGNAGKAFSQVRDEQAKLLGKTPGGLKGKLQNKAMQHSVMKHTGLNKKKLKDAKEDMIAKQNYANELAAKFQRGDPNVKYSQVTDAQGKAAKAQSEYEAANSLAKQIGLKPGFMQEHKRHGAAYVAAARAGKSIQSGAGKVGSAISDSKAGRWVSDKVDSLPHIPSQYEREVSRYGKDAADSFRADREAIDAARDEYKSSLHGGIGASDIDSDKARENLKLRKQDLKIDKKINKN